MDSATFEDLAEETLDGLFDAIDDAIGDDVEVDFDNGILTLELQDGRQYIINKHAASKEIWVSSPVSGAAHYAYDLEAGNWISTREGGALSDVLAAELKGLTGQDVNLV